MTRLTILRLHWKFIIKFIITGNYDSNHWWTAHKFWIELESKGHQTNVIVYDLEFKTYEDIRLQNWVDALVPRITTSYSSLFLCHPLVNSYVVGSIEKCSTQEAQWTRVCSIWTSNEVEMAKKYTILCNIPSH